MVDQAIEIIEAMIKHDPELAEHYEVVLVELRKLKSMEGGKVVPECDWRTLKRMRLNLAHGVEFKLCAIEDLSGVAEKDKGVEADRVGETHYNNCKILNKWYSVDAEWLFEVTGCDIVNDKLS